MARALFLDWDAIAGRVAATPRLAIFTDFDGTLVPFREQANDVQLPDRVRTTLASLVSRGHVVGIVSGRALDDLEQRVDVAGAWYVGVHGFFVRAPDRQSWTELRPRSRAALARIPGLLRQTLQGAPGITIEAKGASVAVHYRRSGGPAEQRARDAAQTAVRHVDGLRLLPGRRVIEILPAVGVDKATAVRGILRREWRRTPRRDQLAIYLGDDIADEHVFARWRGLSIVVGPRRPSAARYALGSHTDVRVFLERLVKICRGNTQLSRSSS